MNTTLHIVSKPSSSSDALERCLSCSQPGDVVLLIEDGVYSDTSQLDNKVTFLRLAEDCRARGVNISLESAVDYSGFVELVAAHSQSCSWF